MAAESMSEGKSKPRLRRWMVTSLAVVVVLIATLVGWTLYQNTYDIREEKVTITGGSVPLQESLHCPNTVTVPSGSWFSSTETARSMQHMRRSIDRCGRRSQRRGTRHSPGTSRG